MQTGNFSTFVTSVLQRCIQGLIGKTLPYTVQKGLQRRQYFLKEVHSDFLYFFKIISKGLCPFIKRKSSKALFILKMIMISFHLEISFHWEISFHLEVSFHLEMIISDKE